MKTKILMLTVVCCIIGISVPSTAEISLGIDYVDTRAYPDITARVRILEDYSIIKGINSGSIELYEDGSEITDFEWKYNDSFTIPLSSVFVNDLSTSMRGRKVQYLKESLAGFIRAKKSEDQVAIISFGQEVRRHTQLISNQEKLLSVASSLEANGNRSKVYDALYEGITMATIAPRGQVIVVILTDGKDNASSKTPSDCIDQAQIAEIPIYVISFGDIPNDRRSTLTSLSQQTGGTYIDSKAVGGIPNAYKIVEEYVKSGYEISFETINYGKVENERLISIRCNYSGKPVEAIKKFKIWSEDKLRAVNNWLNEADICFQEGSYNKVLDIVRNILSIDPTNIEAVKFREKAQKQILEQEKLKEAIRDIEALIKIGEFEGASEKAREELVKYPENQTLIDLLQSSLEQYINAFISIGYYDKAIKVCREELSHSPDNEGINTLYKKAQKLKAESEASEERKRLIEQYSKNAEELISERRWEEARAAANNLKDLYPDHPKLKTFYEKINTGVESDRINVLLIKAMEGNKYSTAESLAKKLLDLNPDYPGITEKLNEISSVQEKVQVFYSNAERFLEIEENSEAIEEYKKIYASNADLEEQVQAQLDPLYRERETLQIYYQSIPEQITVKPDTLFPDEVKQVEWQLTQYPDVEFVFKVFKESKSVNGLCREDIVFLEDQELLSNIVLTSQSDNNQILGIYVLCDKSNSVGEDLLNQYNNHIIQMARRIGNDDLIKISYFDKDVLPVIEWSAKGDLSNSGIVNLDRTPGAAASNIYDSVLSAIDDLAALQVNNKTLLLLSDGKDNLSETPPDAVLDQAKSNRIVIYSIGADEQNNSYALMNNLSVSTGGYALPSATEEAILNIYQHSTQKRNNIYKLAYSSPKGVDGIWHTLNLVISIFGKEYAETVKDVFGSNTPPPPGPKENEKVIIEKISKNLIVTIVILITTLIAFIYAFYLRVKYSVTFTVIIIITVVGLITGILTSVAIIYLL